MAKNMNGQSGNSPEHLDQIRDIIFGPQKRELEIRLEEIQKALQDTNSLLLRQADELRAGITSLDKKVATLKESTTHEEESLRKEIKAVEARLDKSTAAALQTAAEKSSALEQMLHQITNELSSDKVSREELGEMLLNLGKHIQQKNQA